MIKKNYPKRDFKPQNRLNCTETKGRKKVVIWWIPHVKK